MSKQNKLRILIIDGNSVIYKDFVKIVKLNAIHNEKLREPGKKNFLVIKVQKK